MASRYQKLYLYFLRTRHHSMINRFSTSLNGKWMGETDQSRKIENLKSKSFKIEQLSETENTSNTATEDTQGPTKQYWAIYFPPFYRHRLVHYLTPYQILWTFCGWISGQCKCKWELSVPSLTEAPRSLLPYNGKGFIFYRTRVRSLAMLVTNRLTDWLTHSLTHSCLVNLIDVTLACEDAYSKPVEVVTVADVSDENHVGNSLLQIWKLRFGHKA